MSKLVSPEGPRAYFVKIEHSLRVCVRDDLSLETAVGVLSPPPYSVVPVLEVKQHFAGLLLPAGSPALFVNSRAAAEQRHREGEQHEGEAQGAASAPHFITGFAPDSQLHCTLAPIAKENPLLRPDSVFGE